MIFYEQHRVNPPGSIYHQWKDNLAFSPHLHDAFEFIYIFRGELNILIDNSPFTVQAGQAVLVFPNQIHSARSSKGSHTYLCVFQNAIIGEFYRQAKNTKVSSPVFCINDPDLIKKLSETSNSRYQLKAYLYDIIHQFDIACGEYCQRTYLPTDVLGKILVCIATHYTENINMKTIAFMLGYDHHYLSNVLQKYLHTTFRAMLNEYRITQAKHLLISKTQSISAIAYECGYESLVSFNRNFKKIVGTTPSEFKSAAASPKS